MGIRKARNAGQATVEYLFIFAFIAIIGGRFVAGFSDFLGRSFGGLGHVVSVHLATGICSRNCFFGDYENGQDP